MITTIETSDEEKDKEQKKKYVLPPHFNEGPQLPTT